MFKSFMLSTIAALLVLGAVEAQFPGAASGGGAGTNPGFFFGQNLGAVTDLRSVGPGPGGVGAGLGAVGAGQGPDGAGPGAVGPGPRGGGAGPGSGFGFGPSSGAGFGGFPRGVVNGAGAWRGR